nr:hypothetical protein [uncultured Prevotella sp.]
MGDGIGKGAFLGQLPSTEQQHALPVGAEALSPGRFETDTPHELAARGSLSLFIEHNGIYKYFLFFNAIFG